MEKNYQNLSELANNPKPSRNNENNKDNQNKQESNWWKEAIERESFKEYTKDLIKKLQEQNEDYIRKLIREKSKQIYDPSNYIKKLFKDFYWNNDYYKEKKIQTLGK